MLDKDTKIFVAGHTGLVGSAVVKQLKLGGYRNLLLKTRAELDLSDLVAVREFYKTEKPYCVINCAAKVGSIQSNVAHPAQYLYDNLLLQNNLIWEAKSANVKKFVFIASAVIYPNNCPQPMKEDYFLSGEPNASSGGYAHAKIAGIKMCEYIYDEFGLNFNSCVPTNIYGENDNFDPETSHVIPSLIRRFHEAKVNNASEVIVWGTGNVKREFLYVDDLADAIVWQMENYDGKNFTNIGTGVDVSMRELAEKIKALVGYEGDLVFDATKPEGIPRRLFDMTTTHKLGWKHKIELDQGLEREYSWYLENIAS